MLSNTEIRIAVAEYCGWNSEPEDHNSELPWGSPACKPRWWFPHQLPDYPNDLNAMHEAEESLSRLEQQSFGQELGLLAAFDTRCDEFDTFRLAHATARRRAEAFLRVKGKWKE